jgi:hypothetical protein
MLGTGQSLLWLISWWRRGAFSGGNSVDRVYGALMYDTHIFYMHLLYLFLVVIPCKYCCGSGPGRLRDFFLFVSESDLFTIPLKVQFRLFLFWTVVIFVVDCSSVFRIRITLMLIRILLVTLMRIRILPFTLMRIRVQILLFCLIPPMLQKWPSKASTVSLWYETGSVSCFSLWSGSGSGSGYGSYRSLLCGSGSVTLDLKFIPYF